MEEANDNAITEEMINNGGKQSLPTWLNQNALYILFVSSVLVMLVVCKTALFWLARQIWDTLWRFLTKLLSVTTTALFWLARKIWDTLWRFLTKLLSVTTTYAKVGVDKAYRIATESLPVVVLQIWREGIRRIALRRFLTEIRAVLSTQLKPQGPVGPCEIKEELCVVAADQHTLSAIAAEVREATAGIPQAYPVREHRVSNRRDVAELPNYRRAICCVRNAERNISFNKHGEPEPDADLGFRAFHKMEESTGVSAILLLFDHGESQGIAELNSMEGLTPSQRLLDTAKDSPCRFLTVSRKLNTKQKEFIKNLATP